MSDDGPTLRKVMTLCSETGRAVDTGLRLVAGSKLSDLEHRTFLCSDCGQKHSISTELRRAFFDGDERIG